jgi:ABC-type multidrug transport system fused ATPase/permease subunit
MKNNTQSEHRQWLKFIGVIAIITFAGYFVLYPQTLYKPGERIFDLGYNLGLAGGLMMLTLLLYPLRKRVKFFAGWGVLPTWFKWHMVFGILGPLTIIFHSTYHVYIPYIHPMGSPNAAVAMLCMLLVSGSGTFGRFFYSKIHYGLYGRLTTVSELRAELEQSGDVKSIFSFAPVVEKSLEDFRARADKYAKGSGLGLITFLTVGLQTALLSGSLSRKLRRIMRAQAKENNLSAEQLKGMDEMYVDYRKRISTYLGAIRDASQFHTYERLFSWWHIFHIPLVYLMVFSAVYHVYAVHAY